MEMVGTLRGQLTGVLIGLALGIALVIGGVALTLSVFDVRASHEGDDVLHICVNSFTGQARFIPAGQEPNCADHETQHDLAGGNVAAEIAELRDDLDALADQVPDCLSTEGVDAVFDGCNVHVRDGSGDTAGDTNGLGNLIIGYNENDESFERGGSHNLIVGPNHGYTNYGGLVAGFRNRVNANHASVSGGSNNLASGNNASVSGGLLNTASGGNSSVSGGQGNTANGGNASVSGGLHNLASGGNSIVVGGGGPTSGESNVASHTFSVVLGGQGTVSTGDATIEP